MRILCVGSDSHLLESRQMLFASVGADALCVTPAEARELVDAARFDLVILSVDVSHEERASLKAAVTGGTRVIQLQTIISPKDLLELIL